MGDTRRRYHEQLQQMKDDTVRLGAMALEEVAAARSPPSRWWPPTPTWTR
jgi:hypothetical protein